MDAKKMTSKPDACLGHPDQGRRSFMWKAGAGLSAALAAMVPGIARAGTNNDSRLKAGIDALTGQIGILKDENRIRLLHQTYENFLDRGMYDEVVDLFTDDGEVVFNGGVFKNKKSGVNRLFCNFFRSGSTGKKIDYVPGILPDIGDQQDMVDVMPDRKSARARFSYSIQVGAPVISDSILVEMARLHGEGIMKWWEGGTYDLSCVKDSKEGAWKIKRLEFKVLSKACYGPGKPYSRPISVPLFSEVFPEDPAGPDTLVSPANESGRV